jgi:hypothetical protein
VWHRNIVNGVYSYMGHIATTACLVAMMFSAQSSTHLPWTFPSDVRERMRMADLVVSGTIEDTSVLGIQIVDDTELTGNLARVRVDRVFKGESEGELQFTWFTFHFTGLGMIYSGPPNANFRPHNRYLIFLKQKVSGWVVAMPLYALEIELALAPPSNALPDLSEVSSEKKYRRLAEELETAALLVPPPQPGVTGAAATYFPAVFDLLGGVCRAFLSPILVVA